MLTFTEIKAGFCSIGGHTEPSADTLEVAREGFAKARKKGQISVYNVTHNGDDLCLLMVHIEGGEAGMRDS